MDFSGTLARFATGTYTVTRHTPTVAGTDGRAVPGTSSTFDISASVQALNGRDLQILTEGMRVGERRKLYTSTRLQAIGAPDVVRIGADDWQVEGVEDWNDLGAFFKVLVVKVGN